MKRIVVMGLGGISSRVAEGCARAKNVEFYGFCSRQRSRAEAACRAWGAQKAFEGIQELFLDPLIDVIYVCTPSNTHVSIVQELLAHGLNVICEKPLAPNAREAAALFEAARANGCFLMEAQKTLHSPLLTRVRSIVDAGTIGTIESIEACYGYDFFGSGLSSHTWLLEDGGGCSLDIGVYPLCFAVAVMGQLPLGFRTEHDCLEGYGVDFGMRSILEYRGGVTAHVWSTWLHDISDKGWGVVKGSRGYIYVPAYWKGSSAYLTKRNGERTEIRVEFASDFVPEIENAVSCMDHALCACPGCGERETLGMLEIADSNAAL